MKKEDKSPATPVAISDAAGRRPVSGKSLPIGTKSGLLLLKPKEAAEVLAISPRKLWSLTNAKEIPHVRIGRCVRYRVSELERWLESQQEGGRN